MMMTEIIKFIETQLFIEIKYLSVQSLMRLIACLKMRQTHESL